MPLINVHPVSKNMEGKLNRTNVYFVYLILKLLIVLTIAKIDFSIIIIFVHNVLNNVLHVSVLIYVQVVYKHYFLIKGYVSLNVNILNIKIITQMNAIPVVIFIFHKNSV